MRTPLIARGNGTGTERRTDSGRFGGKWGSRRQRPSISDRNLSWHRRQYTRLAQRTLTVTRSVSACPPPLAITSYVVVLRGLSAAQPRSAEG